MLSTTQMRPYLSEKTIFMLAKTKDRNTDKLPTDSVDILSNKM